MGAPATAAFGRFLMTGDSELAPKSRSDRRNYRVMLTQGICVDIALNLANPKLVLPFLYLASGAPVFIAGALIPLIRLSRMLGQILVAPLIAAGPLRKSYMGAGSLVIAAALVLAGLAFSATSVQIVAAVFVAAVIGVGLGQAVGVVAFQHLLGSMVPQHRRTALLFSQTALSGVVAIAVAWALRHIFTDAESLTSHLALLWAGAASYAVSALVAWTLREPKEPGEDWSDDATVIETGGYLENIRTGIGEAFRVPWFRRFMASRMLFLSVELAMPFYAIHAASIHAGQQGTLGSFVIAASAGVIVAGPLWRWLSQTSLKGVMVVAGALAVIAGALAVIVDRIPFAHHEMYYACIFLLVSAADQGIGNARKVYLVEAAPKERRAYYIAGADATIGLFSLPVAFALSVLAHLHDTVLPIYLLAGLNIAAIVSVLFMTPLAGEARGRADAGSG